MPESKSKLLAALDALPEKRIGGHRRAFTPDEDAALLKYHSIRMWDDLAEAFGCSENTLRRRLRELTAGRAG